MLAHPQPVLKNPVLNRLFPAVLPKQSRRLKLQNHPSDLNNAQQTPQDAMGVNLSYGNQRAHSEQSVAQQTHAGSQLTAGRDLSLQATQGDIDIAGSQLKAGRDTTLSAA
ncbi:hemagglutinin repeat-containing protein, partial [Rosenbergiella epipactidis]|uniref:hemagglutinin repeat-containing protein n=1 Tax=Rosenbergiella epipactidis TaxID=1544694 RepID=UPI001F4D8756